MYANGRPISKTDNRSWTYPHKCIQISNPQGLTSLWLCFLAESSSSYKPAFTATGLLALPDRTRVLPVQSTPIICTNKPNLRAWAARNHNPETQRYPPLGEGGQCVRGWKEVRRPLVRDCSRGNLGEVVCSNSDCLLASDGHLPCLAGNTKRGNQRCNVIELFLITVVVNKQHEQSQEEQQNYTIRRNSLSFYESTLTVIRK